MKNRTLKNLFLLFTLTAMVTACNSKTETEAGIESNIENPPTSQDTVTDYKSPSSKDKDSKALETNDATRMSDGKDSVKGEVTPPNVTEDKTIK